MQLISLEAGLPQEFPATRLYILGVGGPMDESGIGDSNSFVWRFAVIPEAGAAPICLAFTAMPSLMRFTREINGLRAFTVPTEAFRVEASQLSAGAPARLLIDPEPADFRKLAGDRGLEEMCIPELEG
jgi:hypothetical protein